MWLSREKRANVHGKLQCGVSVTLAAWSCRSKRTARAARTINAMALIWVETHPAGTRTFATIPPEKERVERIGTIRYRREKMEVGAFLFVGMFVLAGLHAGGVF
jgi:hypothetical protein